MVSLFCFLRRSRRGRFPRGLALSLLAAAGPVSPAGAIVGGAVDAAAGAQAVMVLGSKGSVCSGIVVAVDVILTAAHCVRGAAQFRVHWRGPGGEPVLVEPAAIAVHPGFSARAIESRTRSIDLALVRLPQNLPSSFTPATLSAASQPRLGEPVRAGGYGVTAEGDGRSSGVFRSVTLAAVEPYGPGKILLWASRPEGIGGVCEGDSGGPMFDREGRVAAVSSWSTGNGKARCGKLSQGILVAPQRAFIDETLAGWSRAARWSP